MVALSVDAKRQQQGIWLLRGHVQTYAWGRRGMGSRVARYAVAQGTLESERVSESVSYAELWLGAHPSGEASVVTEANESVPVSIFVPAGSLPFLLKVLSVERALSIQAHPDIALAKVLHKQFPELYKDGNHKPEMCVCLGPGQFEALLGFRPVAEIVRALKQVPEFRGACGAYAETFCSSPSAPDGLRKLFESLMRNEDVSRQQAHQLRQRLEAADVLDAEHALALRLLKQYPNDAGIFAAFLLNHVRLEPGQAIFIEPNEPHAYLEGDCVEIMATSDNVVRAGLTDKHKDVETLCKMLTYRCKDPVQILQRDAQNRFLAPVCEFELECLELERHGEESADLHLESSASYSILLDVEGEAQISQHGIDHSYRLSPGMACLVAPHTPVVVRPLTVSCQLFRARAPATVPVNGL
ncbi:mannose-6-phosphate isomerase [Cyanidioschyzon merolae strain 10D]|uniref:mannose-6-phosphate isomerase n=1 Tax=Cyanidioschyzon merolae (strain NIES-3377 / 10D) TaxID=280699 RepID=M1VAP5_CYAM1|nr:mannose-6-phosphate isomerase [Cyanidioschyzon merolae strain 10D]BAM82214.1 mannose-6-phosphate isomerase [Cyanidioschyzon merolae strain 10D]|eukprot:XP_005538250.1 mannose-6-phosphate isomerase [Cyanidioschyzon merolae strain 10D]